MKKISIFAFAAALSGVAFADAASVTSDNTFGVMKLSLSNDVTAVSIPFGQAGTGGAVGINDLIQTASLPENTLLYVYSDTAGQYDIYKLVSGAWVAQTKRYYSDVEISETSSTASASKTVASGRGMFITLPSAPSTPVNVYLCGQVLSSPAGATVTANGQMLVSAPGTQSGTAFSLSNLGVSGGSVALSVKSDKGKLTSTGDCVEFMLGGEVVTCYKFETDGWMYYRLSTAPRGWQPAPAVPAGTAFWFKNSEDEAKTLTFE